MDDQSVQWVWKFEGLFIMKYGSCGKNLRASVIGMKELLKVEGEGV